MNFQQLILKLQQFWSDYGCVLQQPYDVEVGAGTMNPATFLRALGPEPWKVAYVEPSRRPADGRYGDNPNRLQLHYQFQVLLKPDPPDVQNLYLDSLKSFGIDPLEHDIRFVEDDWESPTLGAWGLGWEVWLDGMEITQFTYFQQAGGIDCRPVSAEITYGIERIAMYIQGVDNVYDLEWTPGIKYRDVHHRSEVEFSRYNFEESDVDMLLKHFDDYEKEGTRLARMGLKSDKKKDKNGDEKEEKPLEKILALPAYDYCLKCSHLFNMLDARGAISVSERVAYIARVRKLARLCAESYIKSREEMGFPLLKSDVGAQRAAPKKRAAPEKGRASSAPTDKKGSGK